MILTAWMAWQQADADAVRAAILALATGKRKVTITYAGPPERSETYAQAQLPDLRALLAEINQAVSGGVRFRRATFGNGFDTRGNR